MNPFPSVENNTYPVFISGEGALSAWALLLLLGSLFSN